jgi:hypothetical protein
MFEIVTVTIMKDIASLDIVLCNLAEIYTSCVLSLCVTGSAESNP